jgi:hypothetical protein
VCGRTVTLRSIQALSAPLDNLYYSCLLNRVSTLSVSRCTCTRNPRFFDPRCAPFPSFSPFRLHNGPCDLLSRDRHHTSRRGFGVYDVNVHTPLGPAICRSPTSSVLLTRVPPNGRFRFRVGVSSRDFPDPSSTGIPICRFPIRWSSDGSRPLTCHLSSTDSWVAHTLYALSGNRVSRFRDV